MPSDPEPSFGERLRRLRQEAGWSQEELAERADLTAAAIGALERGERRHPYPHTLQALARALELTGVDRVALFTSVPRRRSARRPVSERAGEGELSVRWALPCPPTPLVGREEDWVEPRSIPSPESASKWCRVSATSLSSSVSIPN